MGRSLLHDYDALLLDLDGTVYRGGEAVPGAVPAVAAAREQDTAVRFVTNNASRSPREVADHLVRLGFHAELDEVSTSAQAAAGMLADRLDSGDPVLVLGTDALTDEVRAVGLRPVRLAEERPVAVAQGLSPDTSWRDLAEACVAVRAGALWVACNVDLTLPTDRGLLPGNGSLVTALRAATGVEPLVAGKPERPLLDQAAHSADAHHPLVVGDRLDTDVLGAYQTGLDALLVLTGVTTAAGLLAAGERERPRYVSADLASVRRPAVESEIAAQATWTVEVDGHLVLHGESRGEGEPLDALRALCDAWWRVGTGPVRVVAGDGLARAALAELELGDAR